MLQSYFMLWFACYDGKLFLPLPISLDYLFTHCSSRTPVMKSTTRVGAGAWGFLLETHAADDASFFSSSLPVLPLEKLNFTVSEDLGHSIDDDFCKLSETDQGNGQVNALINFGSDVIGKLLPDDKEELLAGVMDDLDLRGLPDNREDQDEYDLFGSGGGLELDFDTLEISNFGMQTFRSSDSISNGINHYALSNGTRTVAGEHPSGEHPSRTLFVRNINSNVEDSELRLLFELFYQYGDIRTLYTACKHWGFVMISYYDIQDARTVMRALQNPFETKETRHSFCHTKGDPYSI
ncbi:hypothetical protein MLD38_029336 [Melastoma candidum]|uniref:Uncharacterized protein n=1 Tax=Melastoma candidum TaxID=119954 RepID=A0ACB9N968_9MYRT|nr:hypothetical protein MLD38_029336 [Melastoma candidum]